MAGRKSGMLRGDRDGQPGVPEDVRAIADRLDALPVDAPQGLEARVYEASVGELQGDGGRRPVLAVIGPLRWLGPLAATAAVVGIAVGLAQLGGTPAGGGSGADGGAAGLPGPAVALDEQVADGLAFASLFSGDWDQRASEIGDEAAWEAVLSELDVPEPGEMALFADEPGLDEPGAS